MTGPHAKDLGPFEGRDLSVPFYEQTQAAQLAESLALNGLLLEWMAENLDRDRWPALHDIVLRQGFRMGPWTR